MNDHNGVRRPGIEGRERGREREWEHVRESERERKGEYTCTDLSEFISVSRNIDRLRFKVYIYVCILNIIWWLLISRYVRIIRMTKSIACIYWRYRNKMMYERPCAVLPQPISSTLRTHFVHLLKAAWKQEQERSGGEDKQIFDGFGGENFIIFALYMHIYIFYKTHSW